jgi:hypothetical protein
MPWGQGRLDSDYAVSPGNSTFAPRTWRLMVEGQLRDHPLERGGRKAHQLDSELGRLIVESYGDKSGFHSSWRK